MADHQTVSSLTAEIASIPDTLETYRDKLLKLYQLETLTTRVGSFHRDKVLEHVFAFLWNMAMVPLQPLTVETIKILRRLSSINYPVFWKSCRDAGTAIISDDIGSLRFRFGICKWPQTTRDFMLSQYLQVVGSVPEPLQEEDYIYLADLFCRTCRVSKTPTMAEIHPYLHISRFLTIFQDQKVVNVGLQDRMYRIWLDMLAQRALEHCEPVLDCLWNLDRISKLDFAWKEFLVLFSGKQWKVALENGLGLLASLESRHSENQGLDLCGKQDVHILLTIFGSVLYGKIQELAPSLRETGWIVDFIGRSCSHFVWEMVLHRFLETWQLLMDLKTSGTIHISKMALSMANAVGLVVQKQGNRISESTRKKVMNLFVSLLKLYRGQPPLAILDAMASLFGGEPHHSVSLYGEFVPSIFEWCINDVVLGKGNGLGGVLEMAKVWSKNQSQIGYLLTEIQDQCFLIRLFSRLQDQNGLAEHHRLDLVKIMVKVVDTSNHCSGSVQLELAHVLYQNCSLVRDICINMLLPLFRRPQDHQKSSSKPVLLSHLLELVKLFCGIGIEWQKAFRDSQHFLSGLLQFVQKQYRKSHPPKCLDQAMVLVAEFAQWMVGPSLTDQTNLIEFGQQIAEAEHYKILCELLGVVKTHHLRTLLLQVFGQLEKSWPLFKRLVGVLAEMGNSDTMGQSLQTIQATNSFAYFELFPIVHGLFYVFAENREPAIRNQVIRCFEHILELDHGPRIVQDSLGPWAMDQAVDPFHDEGTRILLIDYLSLTVFRFPGLFETGLEGLIPQNLDSAEIRMLYDLFHIQVDRQKHALHLLGEWLSTLDSEVRPRFVGQLVIPLLLIRLGIFGAEPSPIVSEIVEVLVPAISHFGCEKQLQYLRQFLKWHEHSVLGISRSKLRGLPKVEAHAATLGELVYRVCVKLDVGASVDMTKVVDVELVPKLFKVLIDVEEHSGSKRINSSVSFAMIGLLSKIPRSIGEKHLPCLVTTCSQFLRSRDEKVRDDCRSVMVRVAKNFGAEYFRFIIKEMGGALSGAGKQAHGGYLRHVLGYSVQELLRQAGPELVAKNQQLQDKECIEMIVEMFVDELAGKTWVEKEAKEWKSGIKEVKAKKAANGMYHLCTIISMENLSRLVLPRLEKLGGQREMSKLRTVFSQIVDGARISMKRENVEELVLMTIHLLDLGQQMSRIGMIRTEFGLELFHCVLRHGMLDLDNDAHKDMIIPIVSFLGNVVLGKGGSDWQWNNGAVVTRAVEILTRTHRIANEIDPNLIDPLFNAVIEHMASSLDKDMNSPSLQACFDLIIELLDQKTVRPSKMRLGSLLAIVIHKLDAGTGVEQNRLFRLLRLVLKQGQNIPETENVMKRIKDLCIVASQPSIREICTRIFIQFLEDYPLSRKQLRSHMEFMHTNMEHEWESGRKSCLTFWEQVFGSDKLKTEQDERQKLALGLVLRLNNEASRQLEKMVYKVLGLLVEKDGKIGEFLASGTKKWWKMSENNPKGRMLRTTVLKVHTALIDHGALTRRHYSKIYKAICWGISQEHGSEGMNSIASGIQLLERLITVGSNNWEWDNKDLWESIMGLLHLDNNKVRHALNFMFHSILTCVSGTGCIDHSFFKHHGQDRAIRALAKFWKNQLCGETELEVEDSEIIAKNLYFILMVDHKIHGNLELMQEIVGFLDENECRQSSLDCPIRQETILKLYAAVSTTILEAKSSAGIECENILVVVMTKCLWVSEAGFSTPSLVRLCAQVMMHLADTIPQSLHPQIYGAAKNRTPTLVPAKRRRGDPQQHTIE